MPLPLDDNMMNAITIRPGGSLPTANDYVQNNWPNDWQDQEAQANLAAIQSGQSQLPLVAQAAARGISNFASNPSISTPNIDSDSLADDISKLTGAYGKERYQLWPERLVRDALSVPTDVMSGKIPMTDAEGHTSTEGIKAALDMSALAGTGGLGGAEEGALGSGPFLRPALKYQGKIYKAPVKVLSALFMDAEYRLNITTDTEFTRASDEW